MTTLILIRHGESAGNREKRFAGQLDLPLTELGKKQAECAAEYLDRFSVDKIYASDLKRAYDTAVPLSQRQHIPIIASENLREINAGLWEGMPYDEIAARFPENYNVWLTDMGNAKTNGGESVGELYDRITSEITRIVQENPNKTVCIATHAAPIRMFECFAAGKEASFAKHVHWVPNASVTIYEWTDSFKLILRGENSYLGDNATVFSRNI